jgi:hypothetical protein
MLLAHRIVSLPDARVISSASPRDISSAKTIRARYTVYHVLFVLCRGNTINAPSSSPPKYPSFIAVVGPGGKNHASISGSPQSAPPNVGSIYAMSASVSPSDAVPSPPCFLPSPGVKDTITSSSFPVTHMSLGISTSSKRNDPIARHRERRSSLTSTFTWSDGAVFRASSPHTCSRSSSNRNTNVSCQLYGVISSPSPSPSSPVWFAANKVVNEGTAGGSGFSIGTPNQSFVISWSARRYVPSLSSTRASCRGESWWRTDANDVGGCV